MNEQTSFERYVIEAFDREGPGRPVPDAIHDDLLSRAGRKRQWPYWLASIKEPPMRLSNSLAVGSPTVRVAAIMAATLLLAVALAAAGIAGSRILAAGADIVVDQGGGGDYTTIAEAVEAAEDGQSILVRNGTYVESVTISKDISLFGESREGVIIEVGTGCTFGTEELDCPADVPMYPDIWFGASPYGVLLQGSDAEISDLTFHFATDGVGIVVNGGAPLIRHITYGLELDPEIEETPVYVHGGSAAVIQDSGFGENYVFFEEGSPATIERSTFAAVAANTRNTPISGGPATIRGNRTGQISFNGSATIEDNEIVAEPLDAGGQSDGAIYVQGGDGWTISGNTISGFDGESLMVVSAINAGAGTIAKNTMTDNQGIAIAVDGEVLVEGNTITDGATGIVAAAGAPRLIDNIIEGMSGSGISVGTDAAVLSGNRSCNNGTDLQLTGSADPQIDDTNEICVMPQAQPAE